ncbi:MAG: LysR family transcriptional regulator [Peptococcaceae bacterium]|nr:LysR family transcriptional regulator [Peptococcaceae bacterium]
MDFHQLRVFVEVARQKSFSRAAERIFLSQPTVSSHIKALENEIGVPLLDRNPRELQLTGAGKILFQYAQQLIGTLEEVISAVQQEYRLVKGHLEIAASSVPGTYILPGLMKGFMDKYPGATFAVMLRDTRQVYESIRDYTYNLGFVGEQACFDELGQIKLTKDKLVLVAAPGTRLPGEKPPQKELFKIDLESDANLEKFLEVPFIMREPGSATRVVFENALRQFYGKKEVNLNIVAYLESQEAIKEAVKIGLGVTVISYKAVKGELAAGLMKGYTLPALQMERDFYLIYRKNRIFSPLDKAFLTHCTKHFALDAKQKKNPC